MPMLLMFSALYMRLGGGKRPGARWRRGLVRIECGVGNGVWRFGRAGAERALMMGLQ